MKKFFETIIDKRQPWKVKHNLLEIVIMTICAVISGCEYWEDITDFCKVKEQWFREKMSLRLENGVASHDTFQRVFAMIKPSELEACFISWIKSIQRQIQGEIVSIDGKTLCGSRNEEDHVIHMVSAWANQNQLVLGQIKTADKSNEIKAIPQLLDLLEIKGCLVTIDAMGCQTKIAEKVVAQEADYLFSLKGNQSQLHEDIRRYFESAMKEPHIYEDVQKTKTSEKGHGRFEKRSYFLTEEIDWLYSRDKWKNLNAIGMVHSVVERKGTVTEETRFFITSVTDIQLFAKAVRAHWGIENSLHWCLDVVFHEDDCQVKINNCAENFAVIRHIALNILKNHPVKERMSLARRRRKCEYDADFMADVLLAAFS